MNFGNAAARRRCSSSGSRARPGWKTTHARTSCSVNSDGTASTADSSTSGFALMAFSTSTEEMFSPRRRIASFSLSIK
jgi:hypothetical protein